MRLKRSAPTSIVVASEADQATRAQELAAKVEEIASRVATRAALRDDIERSLEDCCKLLNIPWTPFQWQIRGSRKWRGVVHGAVLVEYESSGRFRGIVGAGLQHARKQTEAYALLLSPEEGRPLADYVLVAWDGSHINFGAYREEQPVWETLTPFDASAAKRLLASLEQSSAPLVGPKLLTDMLGPGSMCGGRLVPLFFAALQASAGQTNKTSQLFIEWKCLFGQSVGAQPNRREALPGEQEPGHRHPYTEDPSAYLFALHTYIALVARLVAAFSLADSAYDLGDPRVPIRMRLSTLESGKLFEVAGISNMLWGDFFSWYVDDIHWSTWDCEIDHVVQQLKMIDCTMAKKSADATRDLFKDIYQAFVPGALRHALGEYYTPDWLASHALDTLGWQVEDELMDPTCGSGTFLLEGVRRRLAVWKKDTEPEAEALLRGFYGLDLNPLAVLTAKSSLVVSLARFFDPSHPVRLPIFLADALDLARRVAGVYRQEIRTGCGVRTFDVPVCMVNHRSFFEIFGSIRGMVSARRDAETIVHALLEIFDIRFLAADERECLKKTIETLIELHRQHPDGIWCSILADRCAAGALSPVRVICGNPPWVKWSHLPPDYAAGIKPRCLELGVFSEDRWVGGIEADISTVITYEVIDTWLAENGRLGFFLNGAVFDTESSAGFRRFTLQTRGVAFKVDLIEDFRDIKPFAGASNNPLFFMITKNQVTAYPVLYRFWHSDGPRRFSTAEEFRRLARSKDLLARPVPGKGGGPWLRGSYEEQRIWEHLFAPGERFYAARKGVTTDMNGVFWVRVQDVSLDRHVCSIQNVPALGRRSDIPACSGIVETDHLFPLLRGRSVSAFCARPVPDLWILLPQKGMHGDPALPTTYPRTWSFLSQFQRYLEGRSSFKRFQRNKPYWSLWSTGAYTFSPYKVVWKEMSGHRFAAAYIGCFDDPLLGSKVVVPDHKLYFVPLETEEEAAYVTGMLNAPLIGNAISAYASQLSLGVSVVEYLSLPPFDPDDPGHREMAARSIHMTQAGGVTDADCRDLDRVAKAILGVK